MRTITNQKILFADDQPSGKSFKSPFGIRFGLSFFAFWVFFGLSLARVSYERNALGADQPQWGQPGTRNQVSNEVSLPVEFELPSFDHSVGAFTAAGPEVQFAVQTGDQANGVPVVAKGKVYIGTNNTFQTDDRFPDNFDYGVFQCRDAQTGRLIWSLFSPKFLKIKYADWWYIGQCATPVVEDNRIYLVASNGDVLCLDAAGMVNGNDGPFTDELERLFPDETEGKELREDRRRYYMANKLI